MLGPSVILLLSLPLGSPQDPGVTVPGADAAPQAEAAPRAEAPPEAEPTPRAQAAGPTEAEKEPGEDEKRRFDGAISTLGTSEKSADIVAALEALRDGYPRSRPWILDAARQGPGSKRLKLYGIILLGEKGSAEKDSGVVTPALQNEHAAIRLAAVRAIERFGEVGLASLLAYLPGEENPNNRKAAIQTLARWKNPKAVPTLVEVLEKEKDAIVIRQYCVPALEALTGEKLGADVDAWKRHIEEESMIRQAREILEKKQSQPEVSPRKVRPWWIEDQDS